MPHPLDHASLYTRGLNISYREHNAHPVGMRLLAVGSVLPFSEPLKAAQRTPPSYSVLGLKRKQFAPDNRKFIWTVCPLVIVDVIDPPNRPSRRLAFRPFRHLWS